MNCPRGKTLRKSYTRKGKRIAASCVKRTSSHTMSSANFKKSVTRRMSRRLQGVRKGVRGVTKCSPGTIVRKAYVRVSKTGKKTVVPASCIPNVGRPGKRMSPGIGPLHIGELSKHGYSGIATLSTEKRHTALAKAVKEYGSLSTWRKVNALYVYNKSNTLGKLYDADRKWIQKTYGLKAE